MKREKNTLISKENFDEYRREVDRMERRRGKLLAERTYAGLVSEAVFFAAALSVVYSMAGDMEMPVFPRLQCLAGFWMRLCDVALPEKASTGRFLLFSVLAVILISLAAHLLTALVVGLAGSGAPSAPLEGGDAEQAAGLASRCKAAGASLPPRRIIVSFLLSAAYAGLLLAPVLLDRKEIQDALEELGLGKLIIAIALMAGFFMLVYAVPHAVFLWLSGLLYHVRRNYELEGALDTYARQCKTQQQERERAEEERRRLEEAEQKRLQGDGLYRKAIAGDEIDEDLVWQAAELGSRPACLYLGRQMMEAWSTGSYTKEEKADIAEVAKRYFYTASLEENFKESQVEAQFGYLMFQVLTESGTASKWRGILAQLRNIWRSGLLPKNYDEPCSLLIDTVVEMVDAASAQEAVQRRQREEPVVKRCYCKFFNAGVCGWSSTEGCTVRCGNVSDPGQCSIALMNHGLGFEFE